MKKAWLTGILMLAVSPLAFSHTIAVGTVNAGAPGSVTIWLGSYHTGAANEGSMTLNGVTQAFNIVSNALPAGLTGVQIVRMVRDNRESFQEAWNGYFEHRDQ